MAPLTAKERNALPSSAFAWSDEKGGHYPLHDESHVRNAVSRFPQGVPQERRAAVAGRIRSAARRHGIEIGDDSSVAKMGEGRFGVLVFEKGGKFAEDGRIPVAHTGQWVFDDLGPWKIDGDDLDALVNHFHERVYGQDLPIINEAHDHTRAIGWLEDVERDGDWVYGRPKWNATGERLIADDQYRYVSPELMRDWRDPATGVTHSLILLGLAQGGDQHALALTNHPRIKALAMSEGAKAGYFAEVTGTTPAEAVRSVLNPDPDHDGDDDGCAPCWHQPGYRNDCVAFTRVPGDVDGDGGCQLATRGCNAYRSIDSEPAWLSQGGIEMSEPKDKQPQGQSPPDAGTPKSGVPSADAQARADMSETNRLLAAERAERQKLETQVAEMAERERQRDARDRLLKASERIEAAVKGGRITPVQRDAYVEKVAMLSEDAMSWFLDDLDSRPVAIHMGELGSGAEDGARDESERMTQRAQALMSERKWGPEKFKDALLEISAADARQMRVGYRG